MYNPKRVPKMSAKLEGDRYRIYFYGIFNDFENKDKYYFKEVKHGIIYIKSTRLVDKGNLTDNTEGRSRINFGTYKEDGSVLYRMKPYNKSENYLVVAFCSYVDENGETKYAYSDVVEGNATDGFVQKYPHK
jgi:hypothetical protein